MQILEIVKSHPVPIAIGVCVLLLIVSRGSSSASSNNSGAALATSAMNNNTQLAKINSDMSVQLGAQSVEKYSAAENAALQRTGIAASMMNNLVQSNAGVIASSTAANASLVSKALDAATARDQFQANQQTQQIAIQSNIKMNSDNLMAQIQMHTDDNNNKLLQIGAQTQGNLAMMGLAGQISTNQLGMNIAADAQSLPMMLQSQQEMARINGANALAIVSKQTEASIIDAHANRTTAEVNAANSIHDRVRSWFNLGSYI